MSSWSEGRLAASLVARRSRPLTQRMNSARRRDVAQELALPLIHLCVRTKLHGAEGRERRAGEQRENGGLLHPQVELCLVIVGEFHRGQGECRLRRGGLSTRRAMFHVEHYWRHSPRS